MSLTKVGQVWREVEEAPAYEVSDTGEVRHIYELCCLSQQVDENGLFHVTLLRKGKFIRRWVHVLVAEAFLGHPMGHKVIHLDGNTYNNRADNLAWQPS